MATQRSVTPTQPVRVVGGAGKTGRRAERLPARGSEVRIGILRAAGASESLGPLRQLKEVCGVAPLGASEFYERFGFEVVEGGVPGAPVLTAMRRAPRARRGDHQGG